MSTPVKQIKLSDVLTEIIDKTEEDGKYRVLTSSQSGIVSQEEYFNKKVASRDTSGYKIIRKGQFTYRAMSDTGRFYINRLDDFDIGIVSPAYPVFEIKDDNEVSSDYLTAFFKSEKFQSDIAHMYTGSTRASLKFKNLRDVVINAPDKEEQKKRLNVLRIIDRELSILGEIENKLDDSVKSRFIELFGDLRDNSKNWPIVNFCECAKIDTNMIHDFEGYENYPHIGIDSIEKDTGRLSGYRTIIEDGVISGKYWFTPEHIIYSKIRPNLNKVALPDFDGLCSADSYPILPIRGKCSREYLAHVMRSQVFLDYITKFSSRTSLPKVNKKQVEGFDLPLPPIAMQNDFSSFVKETDKSKLAIYKIKKTCIGKEISYMKSNFSFLKENKEYELFADACIDAENVASSAPALSVSGSRKALELAVKWLYAADEFLQLPSGRYTLQDLLHDPAFQDEVDAEIRSHMQYIVRMGNYGIHTGNKYTKGDAVLSLSILFDFVEWIDYCYGADYEERKFDATLIPRSTDDVNQSISRLEEEIEKQKQSASVLIDQKDKEIQKLLEKIEEQRQELSKSKVQHQKTRNYSSQDMSEFETRKRFIDADLRMLGWEFSQNRKRKCVETELEVHGMPKPESSDGKGTGYVDYVLYGDNGDIIALIEAKRTSLDARKGTHQAELYAECIKAATGKKPLIFNTNGFETYLWDKESGPQRPVSGLFSEEDIQHLINLREMRKPLSEIKINEAITDRYYQKAAIRAVCENVEKGLRRSLLVMATGTGKTRVAASLTDVLSRGGYVTNVLFLADRKALVRQAKAAFMEYLGSTNYTYCNLVENKDDKNARMVFSTYPTMLNAINEEKKKDGKKLFSEAHFDLVIIDEAHRSIYNKYAALFEYFDAYIVGLTATPKNMDAASTYSFFKCPPKLPTYAYEYETARDVDHYLVPYYNIEVSTQIMQEGVHYDDLSEDEQEAYENEFVDEDGNMLEYQPPQKINEKIMNKQTVDMVLDDIMTRGLRDASGNHIGKTIIFAQTTPHAKFIVDRFNDLYPQYGGEFCRYVTYKEDYSDNLIEKFKNPEGEPTIIVSIDMMDTGVDVPEVVNLVFFKQVKSKIKFTQMIGRGTRKCPNLFGEGRDKECFYIFDYLGNFEFFRQNKNGKESDVTDSVICMLCRNRASLIAHLQSSDFMDDEYQEFRASLVDKVHGQIIELKDERIDVKRQRRYVEKYKNKELFTCLSDLDLTEICKHIAPLVSEKGEDDDALVFDNLIYGIMLNQIRKGKGLKRYQTVIQKRGNILLEKKMTIPAVKSKADELKKIVQDEYWDKASIMELERMRKSIRDLMKFAKSEGEAIHYTEFEDTWTERTEGVEFDNSEDFEDYEKKVNSYLTTHADTLPIYKLRHNQPLTAGDYEMLSKIFTEELGTQEDYDRTFQDTPLGKLVRRIVKMDHDATMQLFSEYIDEHKWNSQQIAFVRNLIAYVEEHGYIDDMSILLKPPFDRPMPFVRLYSPEDQKRIISIVNDINENATRLVG